MISEQDQDKIKSERLFLSMEMPKYKLPLVRNVVYTVWEKTKSFCVGAPVRLFWPISINTLVLDPNGFFDNFCHAEGIVVSKLKNKDFRISMKHQYVKVLDASYNEALQDSTPYQPYAIDLVG